MIFFSHILQIVYNFEGEHFLPVIVHRGDVVNAVQKFYQKNIIFFKTDDGHFNKTVLVDVFRMIHR